MVAFNGIDPVNQNLKASEVILGLGRLLVNDGTTNTVETTDATNICIGVSAGESSRDADLASETTGATVAMFPLGGILSVQSKASVTYTTGCLVYVGAAGLASATAGSDKVLGIYVGQGQATSATLLTPANASSATEGELVLVNTAGAATA